MSHAPFTDPAEKVDFTTCALSCNFDAHDIRLDFWANESSARVYDDIAKAIKSARDVCDLKPEKLLQMVERLGPEDTCDLAAFLDFQREHLRAALEVVRVGQARLCVAMAAKTSSGDVPFLEDSAND